MFFRLLAPTVSLALLIAPSLRAQNPSQEGQSAPANAGSSGDAEALLALGDEYAASSAGQSAMAAYGRLLKEFPASPLAPQAQYRIARILEESGNVNKAFDAYQTLVVKYPDTPDFEDAIARQVLIANGYLQGQRLKLLGFSILPGVERSQQMYEAILKSAPFSKFAPIAQFNLGLSFERQNMINEARAAYQTVLDKYPNSDVADDAMYQIAYIYMQSGLTGKSQDLSSLQLARDTFEDFLLQFPKSEKAAQARDNLAAIGSNESGDLMAIAKYYDWSKNYKAAIIYYNDIIRKQPKTADAETAKARIEELRGLVGEDALRVGQERAESGEQTALRRRLQAQVETSSLADYSGPPKRDIVPDELPVSRGPRLRTNVRDLQPLPPIEPALPTQ